VFVERRQLSSSVRRPSQPAISVESSEDTLARGVQACAKLLPPPLSSLRQSGRLSAEPSGDRRASLTNSTVIIVLAAFFLEAHLNHIIDIRREKAALEDWARNPGLQQKLAWLYLALFARKKTHGKKALYRMLRRKWRGFNELYEFRNRVSHGDIDRALANVSDARRLRVLAKQMAADLSAASARAGHPVRPAITYEGAIIVTDRSQPMAA